MSSESFWLYIFFASLCAFGFTLSLQYLLSSQQKSSIPKSLEASNPAPTLEQMAQFSWLDQCPDCGKIDHHPFEAVRYGGQIRGVVKRKCTSQKCSFMWYQK